MWVSCHVYFPAAWCEEVEGLELVCVILMCGCGRFFTVTDPLCGDAVFMCFILPVRLPWCAVWCRACRPPT